MCLFNFSIFFSLVLILVFSFFHFRITLLIGAGKKHPSKMLKIQQYKLNKHCESRNGM